MWLVRKDHQRNEEDGERGVQVVILLLANKVSRLSSSLDNCNQRPPMRAPQGQSVIRVTMPYGRGRCGLATIPGFDANLHRDVTSSYSSGNGTSQENIVQLPGNRHFPTSKCGEYNIDCCS